MSEFGVVLFKKFKAWLYEVRTKIASAAGQLYTPRELRALLLFLLTGIAVLLFRFGKQIYFSWFPPARPATEIVAQKKTDSLFFALSAAANTRDSLFFSLPEDSLTPLPNRKLEHHSKEEGLALNSISLNTGSKEDLIRLPSVGPASAELILEYRSERGLFHSLEELKNVHGFGQMRFEKVKKYLRLN